MSLAAAGMMNEEDLRSDRTADMNAHWWRRRRETVARSRREAADETVVTLVLWLVAGALLTATVGFWALTTLEQFGPSVGAVIAFRPDAQASDWWQINARFSDAPRFDRVDSFAGRKCVLSPGTMRASGGSIIVEARSLTRPPVYRVHWAGGHTSRGAGDCGDAADLVLSRAELIKLANVAGGFNNGFGLTGP
jgi:hypothetical protein